MLVQWLKPFYEADDDHESGGDGGGKVRASELRAQLGATPDEGALLRLLEKHAEVLNDNATLRGQRRTLRAEIATLQAKQPAEGTVILTADDAAVLETYRTLGAPDALKKQIEESATSVAELAKLRKAETVRAAAEAAGFKPSVLTTLIGDLDLQMKPGKEGKALAIVVTDGKEVALVDYAKEHWGDFLPALTPTTPMGAPDINAGARSNGHAPPVTTGIVRF